MPNEFEFSDLVRVGMGKDVKLGEKGSGGGGVGQKPTPETKAMLKLHSEGHPNFTHLCMLGRGRGLVMSFLTKFALRSL